MSLVASTVILRGVFTQTGAAAAAFVPPNRTMLLKQIWLWNTGSSPITLASVRFFNRDSSVYLEKQTRDLAVGAEFFESTWIVLNADDHLDVYSSGEGLRYWLSGAVLHGTAGFDVPPSTFSQPQPPPLILRAGFG